jgi:hypothetical protein
MTLKELHERLGEILFDLPNRSDNEVYTEDDHGDQAVVEQAGLGSEGICIAVRAFPR